MAAATIRTFVNMPALLNQGDLDRGQATLGGRRSFFVAANGVAVAKTSE
jgi:hypothetical protein